MNQNWQIFTSSFKVIFLRWTPTPQKVYGIYKDIKNVKTIEEIKKKYHVAQSRSYITAPSTTYLCVDVGVVVFQKTNNFSFQKDKKDQRML